MRAPVAQLTPTLYEHTLIARVYTTAIVVPGLTASNSNPEFKSPAFNLAHCLTILQYQFVFVTDFRIPIFDDAIAPRRFDYLIAVGKKRGFAVDRLSVMPDHMHMVIESLPSLSVGETALAVVNNTRYWMEKNYWGVLKQTGGWDVWKPSFYAGTIGEYSTAQVRSFWLGVRRLKLKDHAAEAGGVWSLVVAA